MRTITRTTTTEMEVTSIRLERVLKDKLKEARKNEICALTGKLIPANETMLLGLTIYGDLVPLSMDSYPN